MRSAEKVWMEYENNGPYYDDEKYRAMFISLIEADRKVARSDHVHPDKHIAAREVTSRDMHNWICYPVRQEKACQVDRR